MKVCETARPRTELGPEAPCPCPTCSPTRDWIKPSAGTRRFEGRPEAPMSRDQKYLARQVDGKWEWVAA